MRIGVYDVAGRLVRLLCAARLPAGGHRITWDGRDAAGRPLGAGTYVPARDR